MSAYYIIPICACVWILWLQIKSLCCRLDCSEAEIYVSVNAKPKPRVFLPRSIPPAKRCETCACVSERWRQQLGYNTLHLSSDTNSPGALWPLMAGVDHAAETLCAWERVSSLCMGAEFFPWEEGRAGLGLGAVRWPSALHEKASSLLCSGAGLCRLLSLPVQSCGFALAGPANLQEISQIRK